MNQAGRDPRIIPEDHAEPLRAVEFPAHPLYSDVDFLAAFHGAVLAKPVEVFERQTRRITEQMTA